MQKIIKLFKNEVFKISLSSVLFILAVILERTILPRFSLLIYILALLVAGGGVFVSAFRGILRRDLLDEKFLMSIASIGAMIVGEWSEGVGVMLFFLVGETFEHYAVRRSRNSIRSLMDICPDTATVIVDGVEVEIDAEDAEIGSIIVIRAGQRVPIDCEIISGKSNVDTSSMTGESLPISVSEGDKLDSGVVVIDGMLTAKTLRLSEDSAAARVLMLVEGASERKAKEESFITRFSHIYTPTVVVLAILVAFIPPIFKLTTLADSVYRALIFLVISCPCALVISVPMAFFGGIGGAASKGILFKGGNVFSTVSSLGVVAFDKTGTVTEGKFVIGEVRAFGVSASELIFLAASAEYASNHPIADCIRQSASSFDRPSNAEEIAGEGVIAIVGNSKVAVGNKALMNRVGADAEDICGSGVYVARDGIFIGSISVHDKIKAESASAVEMLKRLGADSAVIISGDKRESVANAGRQIGADKVYYELTPIGKYETLENIISEDKKSTIYVGDGINDAPALARADVGIAMGSIGQDSAIEASDIVIMTDNLEKIPEAVLIARKTLRISKENIVFALGVKLAVMVLGAFGLCGMWLAVFADVGVAMLAILNSMRALKAPSINKRGH